MHKSISVLEGKVVKYGKLGQNLWFCISKAHQCKATFRNITNLVVNSHISSGYTDCTRIYEGHCTYNIRIYTYLLYPTYWIGKSAFLSQIWPLSTSC